MSNPTNQPDSQAGDELDDRIETLAAHHQRVVITPKFVGELTELVEAYAERLATEARIDELKHMDSLTYSFMSLGNDFDYSYRQSAVDTRIAELRATLTGKADQ